MQKVWAKRNGKYVEVDKGARDYSKGSYSKQSKFREEFKMDLTGYEFGKKAIQGYRCYSHKEDSKDRVLTGKYGYVVSNGEMFWVYITHPSRMLATPDFSDKTDREQRFVCTENNLKPMLFIIKPHKAGVPSKTPLKDTEIVGEK